MHLVRLRGARFTPAQLYIAGYCSTGMSENGSWNHKSLLFRSTSLKCFQTAGMKMTQEDWAVQKCLIRAPVFWNKCVPFRCEQNTLHLNSLFKMHHLFTVMSNLLVQRGSHTASHFHILSIFV